MPITSRSSSAVYSRRLHLLAPTLLLVGCFGSPTGPEVSAVTELYVLERVDGAPLPARSPNTGPTDLCPPAITDGELSIDTGPTDHAFPPLYTISVVSSQGCESNGIPAERTEVVRDAGAWSVDGARANFNSNPRFGFGVYQGTAQPASPGPLLTVEPKGHAYTFRRLDAAHHQTGIVSVAVVDQQGIHVAAALMVFHSVQRPSLGHGIVC